MNKIFIILFLLFLNFFLFLKQSFSEENKIKIGLLVPLSGDNIELGKQIVKATRMALKDINSNEIPVYDGSSLEFVRKFDDIGLEEQDSYKKFIKIKKHIEVLEDGKSARVSPFDNTLITTEIEYPHKLIGKQTISLMLNPSIYQSQVCSARTFGFLKDNILLNNILK